MSSTIIAVIFSVLNLCSAQLSIPNLQYGELSCQSLYNGPNQCRAPGRIVEAWIREQSFNGNCRVYTTFGFVANYLWVRNGCGGKFKIVYQPNRQYDLLYPENHINTNRNYQNCQTGEVSLFCFSTFPSNQVCRVPLVVSRVNFRPTYGTNSGACRLNYGYGINSNGSAIWTNRGCQGTFEVEFQICTTTRPNACRSFKTEIQCGSPSFMATECQIPVEVTTIRLQRSLLATPNSCVENVGYGRSPDGVWVSQGCRASFSVNYRLCNSFPQ